MHPYALIALDIAHDRAHEADRSRLAGVARAAQPSQPSWPRRGLAHAFAYISVGSAAVTRRLDDCIADDLGRSLAPSE